jgi:aspartate aminotransferase, mitochondrial
MRTTALFRAGARVTARTSAPLSTWSSVPMAPADPILGLSEAFQMDADPNKVNLGVGAYRGDDGKPYVLPSVREAEKRMLAAEHNHEYLPIVGLKSYTDLALGFAYGEDSPALTEGRVAAMQTLSGTGSLRLATEYFKRFHDGGALYVPNPTWGNHIPIAEHSGLEVRKYSYFDPSTVGLDFAGMLDDVNAAPENSIFLLHACAHNPTGIDPSSEQWAELANLMKKKNHLPFFDSAYQGFASGDAEIDASSIRHFVAEGHCIALCQSFAKNFGLYGDRIGTLSFVCDDQDETARCVPINSFPIFVFRT